MVRKGGRYAPRIGPKFARSFNALPLDSGTTYRLAPRARIAFIVARRHIYPCHSGALSEFREWQAAGIAKLPQTPSACNLMAIH
jgi:hypothetical protein